MNKEIIKVSNFTTIPGARFIKDGDGSAELFFKDFVKRPLVLAIKNSTFIEIDFDDTWGYASSFINELASRIFKLTSKNFEEISETISLKSDDEPGLIDRFEEEYGKAVRGE